MERPDLRTLPPPWRVLATGFLLSLGLAYAVALLFVFVQSEMKPSGIRDQFKGTSEAAAPSATMEDPSDVAGAAAASGPEAEEEAGDAPGLAQEWRGRKAGLKFPKSLKEMILTTHLHLLSISSILLLVGALFSLSSFPEGAKPWVIAAGFSGLALTYACMWAVRFAHPAFSTGVFLFGLLQALSLTTQILASLRDLLRRRI